MNLWRFMRGVACCERFARISAVAKNREAIMAGNEETRERAREEAAAVGFILHHSSWFHCFVSVSSFYTLPFVRLRYFYTFPFGKLHHFCLTWVEMFSFDVVEFGSNWVVALTSWNSSNSQGMMSENVRLSHKCVPNEGNLAKPQKMLLWLQTTRHLLFSHRNV